MVLWRGWGIIITLLLAVAGAFAGSFIGHQYGDTGSGAPQYGSAIALVITAVINWFIGTAMNRPQREAGADVAQHSLFGMPMEWWSIAHLLAAVAFVILARPL